MTTYTKKFKEFIQEWNPEGEDYIVGYRSLDDSEIRIPLLAVDNSITANKYIRKDIDDYANGVIRFNKGFTTGSNVMSTIYLQGLDGWMGTQKGDFEMNSLILREFLEVPELRKNKITVMGNQFWFTDSAMVKIANATGSNNFDIYFKLEEEEYAPFELNDIIKGIYHYSNGFWTVYLKVYELIVDPDTGGEIGVKAHSMNGRDPRQSMLLARINNSDDTERQGSIFADGLRRYIRVLNGYDANDPTSEGSLKTLKVQMGDLSTITNHPIFGDLEGYGLYADNVYLTGKLIVKNDPDQPGQELGVYRGVWNATSNYYKYDQVTYKGSLYTSKQVDNIGHVPTGKVDDLWWELTVAKGEDGTSGESNITLELTNDNHTIPTDSEGKNPSYGGAYSTAYVYQGTNDVTDIYTITATVEAPVTSQQLQIVQNDNTATITYIADNIDAAAIKFTATAEGYPTVSRIWNISKVKSGVPGASATAYWIVTDSPVIKKHIYTVSGSEVVKYEPSPFVVRAFAQTGKESIRQFDGYFRILYGTQVQIVAGSVYQFTPTADVTSYTIEFFLEQGLTTLLDKEVVTVVSDGNIPNWQTYIFKPSTTTPATPTYTKPPTTFPTAEGWYDYPNDSTSVWWMSTATINGITNTVYNWSKPVKVTGEDGEDGKDGKDGTWTDFKFAKNSNANTSPSIVVTDRNPTGWADTTPTIGSGEFLWMTRAVINPDNTLKTNWSNPVRISGEKGDTGATGPQGPQGLHGEDGLQGPSIAFGGNWSATTQYYGYADTQTCVYYNGKYYYTKTASPDLSPITIPSGAANNPASATGKIYWSEFVGQFSNIATGLLLAERIATSELTANKLFIVDRQESTGNIIAADGSIITKEEEKNLSPAQIIGRLTTGWYMDQGVIRSIAVNSDSTPKLKLDKDGKITATGVNITGTVYFQNGTIGSMQVFNDSTWTSTVNGPYPASTGFYYLRKNAGVTITPQGHIIGKDYFLTGDSTQGPSVFIGDVYVPGSSVPGTDDNTLTSFIKLFNSLFERTLVGEQYMIKAKLPLFSIGDIVAYGSDGMDIPSFWEGIPVDKVTIDMINGKLTVIGGTGGIKGIVLPSMTAEDALVGASINSSGDTITFTKGTFATKAYVTWANVTGKPDSFTPPTASATVLGGVKIGANITITGGVISVAAPVTSLAWSSITSKPTTISGYGITDAVLTNDSRLTNARPASDVYAWAKASVKPSYAFSEIASKPTTVAGYGITDAVTLNTAQDITANKKWTNGANSVMITTTGVITIDTTTTGGWSRALEFYGNSTFVGMFGAYGSGSSLKYMYVGTSYSNPWQTWSNLGSTIYTGNASTEGFVIDGSNANGTNMGYYNNGVRKTQVGWASAYGSFIQNNSLASAPILCLGKVNTLAGSLQFGYNNTYYNVLHTGNYNSYSPTLTGGGASGNWNIKAYGLIYPSLIATDGAFYVDAYTFGSFCSNSGIMPSHSDGYIMGFRWTGGNRVTQLALDVDPTYSMAIRHRDNNGVWKDWKNIITEVNIGNYEARSAKYISNSGSSTTNTTGWFRIASTSNSDASGNVITLYLKRNYSYANNENYIFQICNVYSGNTTITQVAGYANTRLIDQIRVTGAANSGGQYIDIHVNVATSGVNSYEWIIIGNGTAQSAWTVNPSAGAVTATFYTAQGFSTSNILKGNYLAFRNYNDYNDAGFVGRGAGSNNTIYLASYNNNTVHIDAGSGVVVVPNSNFGIGTTTPSAKLHVVGSSYFTSDIACAGRLHVSMLSIVSDTWTNVLKTPATYNVAGDNYVAANTSQLVLGWQSLIPSGYRTTYRIGSTRGASGFGEMRLWIGNNDAQTDGKYLSLSGGGLAKWSGNMQSDGTFYARSNIESGNSITSGNWYYAPAAYGYYITGGVYYRSNSNFPDIYGISNEICFGSNSNILYVNYRKSQAAGNVTEWRFHAGSSATYATIMCGNITSNGTITATGDVVAFSDIRLKTNISNLSIRGRLNPKTYIKDGKQSIGFIAQEIQQLYPELVLTGDDENHYLALNYGNLTAVLAAQLNQVDDEVTVLKRKVAELENEIIILKNERYGHSN